MHCILKHVGGGITDKYLGLFYQGLPKKTLHMKGGKCSGGKHSKVRLTGMAAASATGEKLTMFVIGKSVKPRCFKNIKSLPCRYRAQAKSWMDSFLFDEWVKDLDKMFERESRKVALIVDNCPAHPKIEGLKAVELVFLSPNTTSKTQPMNQGVIRSLKAKYRRKIIRRLIRAVDTKKAFPKTSILDKNCFRKAGISEEVAEEAINEQDDPFKDLSTDELEPEDSINEFRERFPEEVHTEQNATILLDIDAELSTSGGKPSDADILAEIRGGIVDDEEADDALEVEDEPPVCPTSLEVDKDLEVLRQLYSAKKATK